MNHRLLLQWLLGLTLLALCPAAAPGAGEAVALVAKGDAFDKQLKTREALAVYLEAEKLSPHDAEILHRVAKQYAESMNDSGSKIEKQALGEKALDYARRAVAADGKNAKAHLALAICYGRLAPMLDNKTKISYSKLVKESAERSLQLDATSNYTYHVLGAWNFEMASLNPLLRTIASLIYGSLPSASYEKAAEYFRKALEIAPACVAHHIELGRTYAALGKSDLAKAEFKQGLSLPSREKDDEDSKQRGRTALAKL